MTERFAALVTILLILLLYSISMYRYECVVLYVRFLVYIRGCQLQVSYLETRNPVLVLVPGNPEPIVHSRKTESAGVRIPHYIEAVLENII